MLLEFRAWCNNNLTIGQGLKQRIGGVFRRSAAKSGLPDDETGSCSTTTSEDRPRSQALSGTGETVNEERRKASDTPDRTVSFSKDVVLSHCTDSDHETLLMASASASHSRLPDQGRALEASYEFAGGKQLACVAGIEQTSSSPRRGKHSTHVIRKRRLEHGATDTSTVSSTGRGLVQAPEDASRSEQQLQREINSLRAKRANLTLKVVRIGHEERVARHKMKEIENQLQALMENFANH